MLDPDPDEMNADPQPWWTPPPLRNQLGPLTRWPAANTACQRCGTLLPTSLFCDLCTKDCTLDPNITSLILTENHSLTGHLLPSTGQQWSSVTHHWTSVTHHWSYAIHHWSSVTQHYNVKYLGENLWMHEVGQRLNCLLLPHTVQRPRVLLEESTRSENIFSPSHIRTEETINFPACEKKAELRRIAVLLGWTNPYNFTSFLASRIWILPSSSKISKKNIHFYCFVTSLWIFHFKEWYKSTFKK